MPKQAKKIGQITQIMGPVVDVEFEDHLPAIYNALQLDLTNKEKLMLEVEQQLSTTEVRCIALGPTEGLQRGTPVADTGKPITVPVGEETLGRMFNVTGDVIDEKAPLLKPKFTAPIHRPAPKLSEQETSTEVLETGIKVIDLIAPFPKGN